MKIRYLLLSLLLILALSVPTLAKEPLVFVVHGSAGAIESYNKIFDRFTAETGIEVEILHTATAIHGKWEQIVVLTAGGVSPDVVAGVSTEFGEFAFNGMLEPLDSYVEADGLDKGLLLPSFTEALQLNGRQYILPYGSSALVMAYNKTQHDAAGLMAPPKEWGSSNWTWDHFVDAAKKLTLFHGTDVSQWGVAGYPVVDHWQSVPYAFGGNWLSDDLSRFLGTEAATVNALRELTDLAHVHDALNPRGNQDDFLSGFGSMAGVGTWLLPRLARADIDWDFMPWFRYQNNEPAGVLFPIGFGMLSASKKKAEAWELIKWLIWNEENNFEYAEAAGAVPSLISNLYPWVEEQQEIFGYDISIGVVAEQIERYNAVVEARKTPAFSRINPILRTTVQSVFANEVDPRAAMDSVADSINQMLQDALK